MPTLNKYELDRTGKNPTNRVENELHPVGGQNNMVFVPLYGPFYTDGLIVATMDGRVLMPGVEYRPVFLYQEATLELGREVYTSIEILSELIIGDVRAAYQVVGGEYGDKGQAIADVVENLNVIDPTVHWDDIAFKPDEYNPLDHKHLAVDLIGMTPVVVALEDIRDAIIAGQEGMDLTTRVSRVGHTKLVTDEALLKLDAHVGPVVLSFGRSQSQNSRLSLDFRVMGRGGTGTYNITADEVEDGFENVSYQNTSPLFLNLPMAIHTDDGQNNLLILGSHSTTWDDVAVSVDSLTVTALDTDSYLTPWMWSTQTSNLILPEMTIPTKELDSLTEELTAMQTAIRALSDLIHLHINDRDDPHNIAGSGGQLSEVENYGVSTNLNDDSATLYATAKTLHELGHITSDALSQLAEDLEASINAELDRGITF